MVSQGMPQTINGKVYIETDKGYEELAKIENVKDIPSLELQLESIETSELPDFEEEWQSVLAATETFTAFVEKLSNDIEKAVSKVSNTFRTIFDVDVAFTESNNYRHLHGKPTRRGIANNPYYHYLKQLGFSDKGAKFIAKRAKKGR